MKGIGIFIYTPANGLKSFGFDLDLIFLLADNGKIPQAVRHGGRFTLFGNDLDIGHGVFVIGSQHPVHHTGLGHGGY
jgi:hypothetical protein